MTAPCVGRADLYDAAMHDAAAYDEARQVCASCSRRAECLETGTSEAMTGVYGAVRLVDGRRTRALPRMADARDVPSTTCFVDGCDRYSDKRGMCARHYQVARRAERAKDPCAIADCAKPSRDRGMCHMHYKRWRVYGDPLHGKASA